MRMFQKTGLILLFLVLIVFLSLQTVDASSLTGLTIGGSNVNYYNTSIQVQIPDVYEKQKFEMRGVWISAFAGDVAINGETQFKTAMNKTIETMKYFNLNAMVFHIRTHNDAFYPSTLNPKSNYVNNINFSIFDPVEWLISRCHEEGIEFHGWMNPYRVNTSNVYSSVNPASSSANLLTGSSVTILNPALANVREFLYDTVMEVIEKYDVDAIHFDDYFYADGAATSRSADDKRSDVDKFIQELSSRMRSYNSLNNRHVQLGISPTGVYRNGGSYTAAMDGTYDANGTYSSTGSNTVAQDHYASYLFSDTKKWIDNEWLDYITPQSYWGFTHNTAKFADVMDWWAKVVAQKKVNLYSGMGLYMANSTSDTYSWKATDYKEAERQVRYVTKWSQIQGVCIYSFRYLQEAKDGGTSAAAKNANNLLSLWDYKALTPEIRTLNKVTLGSVQDFRLIGDSMNWSLLSGARKYAIYRSTNSTINSTVSELLTVVGNTTTSYKDTSAVFGVSYTYAIRAISGSNTEGDLTYLSVAPPANPVSLSISGPTQMYISQTISLTATVLPSNASQTVTWTSSKTNIATVNSNGFVVGVSAGVTRITAKSTANAAVLGVFDITVLVPVPSSLNITGPQNVSINSSIALAATVLPNGAVQNVVWASSNEKVASINSIGVLLGNGVGSVTITASSVVNPHIYNTYQITVSGIAGVDYQDITLDSSVGGSIEFNHYDLAYGKTNTIISTPDANYRFVCLTEDGKIVSTDANYNFLALADSAYKSYFIPINKKYVLFFDQSRTLIDIQAVTQSAAAVAPNANLIPIIPGYTFMNWDKSFTNITNDLLVYAMYQKSILESYNITVINGTVETVSASFDSEASVTALNPGIFSYWLRNNEIVSYNSTYTFSVYGEETLEAVDNDGYYEEVEAILNPNVVDVNLEEGQIIFIGGIYLPKDCTLIETGMLIYQGFGINVLSFSTVGITKVKVGKISPNNEFAVNINGVFAGTSWNVCTYVSYLHNGVIEQRYSQLETYSLEAPDLDSLLLIIATVPTHINSNYAFPNTDGVTWSYQAGEDASLFNLVTGTHTGMELDITKRTLIGTLNSASSTFEVNFGILAEGEIGKFYHEASDFIPDGTWRGWTLTKESDNSVLFLVKDFVDCSYSTPTTLKRNKFLNAWNNVDRAWTTCGNIVRNTGTASVTFSLSYIAPTSEDKGIKFAANGKISQIYANTTTVILLPGESLLVAEHLERSLNFGLTSDFVIGTNLVLKQIKSIS